MRTLLSPLKTGGGAKVGGVPAGRQGAADHHGRRCMPRYSSVHFINKAVVKYKKTLFPFKHQENPT